MKPCKFLLILITIYDINENCKVNTRNYDFYNDREYEISTEALDELQNYEIKQIPWSRKEEGLTEFSVI